MTVTRSCRACGGWHDLTEAWPGSCLGHFARGAAAKSTLHIIKDIEPYKAVAGDIALQGKPPAIGSRREHREFLKRNGYVEIGNEALKPRKPDYGPEVTGHEIKQTIDQLRNRK